MNVSPTTPGTPKVHDVSRRAFLRVGGLAGLIGLGAASGCTDTSDVPDSPTSQAPAGQFDLPDNPQIGSAPTTVRWTDSGDQKANFFKPFFDAYHAKHDTVDITYSGTNWTAIQQQITLGVRNGTAPDVFQLPATITLAQAFENGWIGAFDDIVPDWAEVKKRFPAGFFAEGITDFSNKTYGFPMSSTPVGWLLLSNKALTDGLDYDLTKPLTWDQYRALAKALTTKGKGDYYGLIMGLAQPNGMQGPIDAMCWMSGVHGGASGINWKTGDYNFTDPMVAEAVNLFLAMKSDGSIFPGSTSLIAATARGRFPQGVSGTILQGPWNISPWTEADPNFQLGVSLAPVANPSDIWPIGVPPGGGNNYVYSAKTKATAVIGDIFNYLGSQAGQAQWAQLDGAGDPPAFPDASTDVQLDPLSAQAIDINKKHTVLMPEPAVRNAEVETVYQVLKAIQPTFADVCVGLYTGQIKGVKQAMQGLQDRSNAALDAAIAAAKKRGATVSRDDWMFADWDPKAAYTKLYEA